jgi:hypothetical protein
MNHGWIGNRDIKTQYFKLFKGLRYNKRTYYKTTREINIDLYRLDGQTRFKVSVPMYKLAGSVLKAHTKQLTL